MCEADLTNPPTSIRSAVDTHRFDRQIEPHTYACINMEGRLPNADRI
jgi:hypothetical protein